MEYMTGGWSVWISVCIPDAFDVGVFTLLDRHILRYLLHGALARWTYVPHMHVEH